MSRVSDAMRRAGHNDDEQSGTRPDDTAFVTGEEGVEDAGNYEPPPPDVSFEAVPAPMPMDLVPQAAQATAIPIDVTRSEPAGDDVRLQEVLRILFRRKWLIAGIVAVFMVGAATYNRLATPIYEARARVLVQPTAPQVATFRSSTEDPGRLDYFVTQIEVLRSKTMARKALQDMKILSSDPATQAGQIGRFVGSLSVTPATSDMGESRVINVAYKSTDPKLAAQMANGLANAYVAENLQGMRQGSLEASKWLKERLDDLKRQAFGADSALQAYREKQDAVSLDQGQNVTNQAFLQLSTAVITAQADRLQKESLYQGLEDAMKSKGAALDTFTPILSNSAVGRLKAELNTLQEQRRKLSETMTDENPAMVDAQNAIDAKQRDLTFEINKVATSLKQDRDTARANEQSLMQRLEKQKQEVLELNKKAIMYGALQRDASSWQQTVESVLQKIKDVEISGSLQTNNIKILDGAEVPGGAIWPRKDLNLAIAFLGGAFLALGLVFVLEYMNPRLAEPEDIAGALGLPLLGIAPQVAELDDRAATLNSLPVSFQEAIRGIRTQIFLSAASSGVRTLAVTSSQPGEGKTVVSSSLAISMAMAGRRVLLIDADLRRAQLRHVFNIPRSPGLSNIIAGEIKPSQALVESSVKGLFILPAGAEMSNPGDLLDSERLNQLIQGLRHVFDVVVIDCPPVMAVADASIVANAATSVVFVVGSGTTSPEVARLAVDRLASVQARIVGVVLNKAKINPRSDYYYPYHAEEIA